MIIKKVLKGVPFNLAKLIVLIGKSEKLSKASSIQSQGKQKKRSQECKLVLELGCVWIRVEKILAVV